MTQGYGHDDEKVVRRLKKVTRVSSKRRKQYWGIRTFICALRGVKYSLMSQRNMQIHVVIGAMIIFLAVTFHISRLEWIALLISVALVIMAELFNTAIEVTVDLVTKKTSVRAMLAKDIAAGAVLVLAFNAFCVGCLIFYGKVHNVIIGGS